MANGRMLARKISTNKSLPLLISGLDTEMGAPHGAMAALLYTWSIGHLDVEGRMNGDPDVVKGNVMPRVPFVTVELVDKYLCAMAKVGLVEYYEADGDRWLEFLGFDKSQPGLRKDREPPSNAPDPSAGKPVVAATSPRTRETSAAVSAHTKNPCGAEVNRSEVKGSETNEGAVRVDGNRFLGAWTRAGLAGLPNVTPLVEALRELPDEQLPDGVEDRFCKALVRYRDAYLAHKQVRIPLDPVRIVEKHFASVVEVMLGKFDLSQLAAPQTGKAAEPPRRQLQDAEEYRAKQRAKYEAGE